MKITYLLTRSAAAEPVRRIIVVFLFAALSLAVADGIAEVIGEGPGKTGSDVYKDGGADGNGITIAVIDNGFCNLAASQGSGDAPPWDQITDTADFTGGGVLGCGGTHGTKCLEGAYDHAPGADYCLYRVGSGLDASELNDAIDRAVDHNVGIISMSITFYNQGWEDGSGGACTAVKTATDAGILVFAAAGNFAMQHWRGMFNDPDDDNRHNWWGIDEYQNVTFNAGDTMPMYLQWDNSGGVSNYDLYLYNATEDVLLESSEEDGGTPEYIRYGWPGPGTQTVKIRVNKISGDPTMLQLFVRRGSSVSQTLEYVTGGGSISSPANSDEIDVLAIGAVNWDDYDSLPHADGVITTYSSMGPSNSGRIEPDLVAPTNCSTSIGRAGGTSAATPNAAGTAAAFWSSAPYLSAEGVRYLLLEKAEIFKDWGVSGNDTIYGRGGIRLHTYHDNTIWVDRDYENTDGLPWLPLYYVSDAQGNAIAGGRTVFLGGSYSELIVLNKEQLYESIGGSAVIGE